MQTIPRPLGHNLQFERRLNDIGWGLLLILTGALWLLPPTAVPAGTWLFGVAAILLGVNVVRYVRHTPISGISLAVGVAVLLAAVSQLWRSDAPLVAILLLVIGAGLLAKPLFSHTA